MQNQDMQDENSTVTGINVTPMVDITLVLLIIFMVTATFVSNSGLNVNLPKASSTQAAVTASLTVTLDAKGGLYLMKDLVDENGLRAGLAHEVQLNPGVRVSLAADRSLPYGQVVKVLDLIRQAGVSRLALSSERD